LIGSQGIVASLFKVW